MIELAKEALNISQVLKEVSSFCYSEKASDAILNSEYLSNYDDIQSKRVILNDILDLYQKDHSLEIGYYEDIKSFLKLLKPEYSIIPPESILKISSIIEITNRLSQTGMTLEGYNTLKKRLSLIVQLKDLLSKINRVISESGTIKDNASSKLSSVRRSIRFIESHIRSKTLELAKSKYKDYLIDSETTIRNGMTVLAVKSEHINYVGGIVHGYSNTGGTAFIEPEENTKKIRELNNLQSEELKEIDRILRDLCAEIREHLYDIESNYYLLVEIDTYNAKAVYARKFDCVLPKINTKSYKVNLIKAYHPVLVSSLKKEEVVPLDIEFGDEQRIIIISGPNAGGKTVALKTIGTFCLLNQMVIPLPCDSETELPIFHQIFCDIGDHQSINNDLSTFSSHIQNIKQFLDKSSIDTLILLDELGTGTDPKEGSALAQAFLTQFLANGSKVVATTHIGELKVFASETDFIQNASISFNEKTLTSTYKLLQNIPGQSYAFSIAERYGISRKVVKDAKSKLSQSDIKIEKLIKELHEEISFNEQLKKDLDIHLAKANTLESMYEKKLKQIKKYEKEVKDTAVNKANQLLQDVNKKIEKTIYDLRKTSADKDTIKKSKETVHKLKEKVVHLKSTLKIKPDSETKEKVLQIGDRVKHIEFQTIGEIIEINSGKYRLQLGNLTMHVEKEDIEYISSPNKDGKKQHVHLTNELSSQVKNEVDVRGKYFDEAWDVIDEYIEMALSTGWEEVSIIHGKGTGVLGQKINEQLKHDKRLLKKRFGKHGEGDTGVTILTLRH